LSTFVELEIAFEASIVNLSIFDNGESQFESLSTQIDNCMSKLNLVVCINVESYAALSETSFLS